MPEDDLGISVLKSACSSEAKDLAVEWAELGLDALLDEAEQLLRIVVASRFAWHRKQSRTGYS